MASGRRSSFVLAVAVVVACSSPGGGPNAGRRAAPRAGDPQALRERYDEPLKARDFFALKRAPVGQTTVPVERYRVAREQMKRMPLYSTRSGTFVPRRSGGLGAAAGATLGTWSALGPGNVGGRTRALAINPVTPTTMYAGGVAGGVWKTINGGTTWTAEGDDMANLAVTTLALRPGTPSTILAGTGEGFFNGDAVRGAGIFRSTDSGGTWTQTSAPSGGVASDFHYVNKIVFYDAGSVEYAFAATGAGIYRAASDDGNFGNWRKVTPTGGGLTSSLPSGGCLDLAIGTSSPTLFASCGTFVPARVYRATNAAVAGTSPALNWSSYAPSLDGSSLASVHALTEARMGRTSLAIAPGSPNVVYAVAADNQSDALWSVYYSSDGGNSWETRAPVTSSGRESELLLTNPPFAWPCAGFGSASNYNQGWYDNAVAVDPTNSDVVWVGGIDLFRSDDGGNNFGLASFWWVDPAESAYAHADQHTIVFHPNYDGGSNKQVFFGNDGGIFKSVTPDGAVATGDDVCFESASGVAFESLNNGYGVTQFYYGAVYPDDEQFLGGTQDNGTIYGSEVLGANAWKEVAGGDGGAVAVDPDDTDILYAEYTFGDIQKCTQGSACIDATFSPATAGIADNGFLFIAPFILDPTNSNFLYTGGTYLWRTQNKAASWLRASSSTGSQVSAVAVAPSNGTTALMGTRDGYIHRNANVRTSGSGTTWAKVRPRTGYVSSVAFDPYDPNVAYATYSTFNDVTNGLAHVYKTTNAGATWTSADSGAGRLPDIPVHSVVVDPTTDDPGAPRRLYVGTDIGVFISLDGGAIWAQENTQFPNTVTEQLVVGGASLYAFTHGRGAFRVPLTDSGSQTVRLDMVASATSQAENVGTVAIQFKVRTSNNLATGGAVSVEYATVAGSATAGADFTGIGTTSFVVPSSTADEAIVSLNLPGLILNDTVGEPPETFTLQFTNPSAGLVLSRTSHPVTITNDGDPVGVRVLDLAVTEGNGPGNTTASVVVQLNYPADTPVTVNYTTTNGSATSGADYVTQTGVLSFAVGQSTKTIAVPIVGDTCPEPSKAFLVDLTGVSPSGILEDNQATVSLNDNDFSGTFQLSAPRFVVSESATKAMVTVARTGGLGGGAANCVGFSLATQDGTAASGAPADFTATGPGPFFFAAGATTRVVEVPIVNDTQDEPEESFVVRLSSPIGLGSALGAQQTSVVAITDNDTAGVLQFSASAVTVAEGAGTVTLTVTRTGGNTGPLTVDVQIAGSSTATGGGVDFSAPPQLTFNASQSSVPLVVSLTADAAFEGNEVVTFVLANPTLGATIGLRSTLALTITDAQPTVFFAAPTFTVNESAKSATITVKRAGGVLTDTVQVNYATSAIDAEQGVGGDYLDVSGTLVFTPNAVSKTFVIPLLGDLVVEGNETVNLTLSAPSGGSPAVELGAPSTAILTITENDLGGAVAFGAATYATKEPLNTSTLPTKLNVTIKRAGGVAQGATVLLSTVDGIAATGGSDFTAISKTLTFAAGKSSITEVVEILNDPSPEGPESFTLTLTGPGGGASLGTPTTATVTIADNEPVIEWSASTFSGKEPLGAAATSVANLTLRRTGSLVGDATVNVLVGGGTATFGSNPTFDVLWSPNPQTVALPNGKSTVTLPITIHQDTADEGLETLVLQLQGLPGAAVGPLATTTLKITDEEPTVQFSLAVFSVNEPGGATPTNAVITVKRTGNLNFGTNVTYATSDSTATAGFDYTAIPPTVLNFPAKASSKTFTVQLLPDANDEVDEIFRVTLSGAAGGSLGTPVQADVKIKDNDTAGKLQFQVAVASVAEEAGSVDLVVTRTSGTGAATVDFATQDGVGLGAASSGTDFASTVGTLTFAPGESSRTITILITNDVSVEGGEYFTLVLSNPGSGAVLGTPTVATVWIVDND